MKNNKQEINNELKKLGLRRIKNPVSFDNTIVDKHGVDYDQLGIDTVSNVKDDLDTGEANYEETEPNPKKSEWKTYRKARQMLDKAPKDSYAIVPRHSSKNFGYANLEDIANIATGYQPTAKALKRNYIHKLMQYQERFNKFEQQADKLNNQITNKSISNDKLGKKLSDLRWSEAMNAQNDTIQKAVDKNRIIGLDEVHDAVEEDPTIITPEAQTAIDSEVKHFKSNPRYQNVQMVKNPTGKHDFKPLSNKLAKNIITNAHNQAVKSSRYLSNRMKAVAPKQQVNFNRKLRINNEINKLGLHNKGSRNELYIKDNRGFDYDDLGVNTASFVREELSDAQTYENNTNVYWTDKDSELTDKAINKLNKVPKNNYVISPHMSSAGDPSMKDIKKIIQGKKPTIQSVRKNYIHSIKNRQQGLHKFERNAQHIMKQTKNKGLNHEQLGDALSKIGSKEVSEVGTHNIYRLQRKNHIASLDNISDDLQNYYFVGDTDIDDLPQKQQNILTETNNKLDDPRYTYYVQAKAHLTGKNDFKPLSHKMVNDIVTKANNVAIKNSRYFTNKLNRLTASPSINNQTKLLHELHINKPSIDNRKHINSQHQSIDVKKRNRKPKRIKTREKHIERGPQI